MIKESKMIPAMAADIVLSLSRNGLCGIYSPQKQTVYSHYHISGVETFSLYCLDDGHLWNHCIYSLEVLPETRRHVHAYLRKVNRELPCGFFHIESFSGRIVFNAYYQLCKEGCCRQQEQDSLEGFCLLSYRLFESHCLSLQDIKSKNICR